MPRGKTLSGRIERNSCRSYLRGMRSTIQNHVNAHVNNNPNNANNVDVLINSYKVALNLIPRNFESFNCGGLSLRCMYCRALNFQSEITQRSNEAFTLCCHKGKVNLPPISQNIFIENMIKNIDNDDPQIKRRSKNYMTNIRAFNSAFAMVSAEAKLSNVALNGIYHFKIHDIFYHRAGSLIPENGNEPTYAQLYAHKLALKENCIVLLIRNLNTDKALVNGTRMRIKRMYTNMIDCEVLTGVARNTRVLIPRIHLTYSGSILPFSFQRTQFPLIPAFAMTINKSQGQTFERVGLLLRRPVFTHGQMYVAASRVRSFDGLRIYVSDTSDQGHLHSDDDSRVFTKNIVYREVINF